LGRRGKFILTETDFDLSLPVFARRLRRARRDVDLTQSLLAEQVGVSQSSVDAWERGRCLPRARMIPLLAEVLGISVDDLFGLSVPGKTN
jgi:transcriptional regulator with XRE-family HTH domain